MCGSRRGPKQTNDRDDLARLLHRQLRDQLRGGFDLGLPDRRPTHSSIAEDYRPACCSSCVNALTFVLGYHGAVADLDHFVVRRSNTSGPGCPSLGAARPPWPPSAPEPADLMASNVQECVPDAVANAFSTRWWRNWSRGEGRSEPL